MLEILRFAIESASNSILITDATQPDNPIIYCNAAFESVTGYSREEATGRNCRFLQGDDRHQDDIQKIRNAVKKGSECKAILRNYRKDGSAFWNELHISPIRNNDGKLTHFVGVQNDVTKRVEAEEALARNEQQLRLAYDELESRVRERTFELQIAERKYRNLVETSHDLIWSVDANGRWTFLNRIATKRIYGYEPEEMLGRKFMEFTPPDRVQADLKTFERIKSGETFFRYETVHIRKDGELVNLSFNAIVLHDDEGKVIGTTGTASDISDRIRAQDLLESHRSELAHMGRMQLVGEMASGLAHELNQPLGAISLQSEVCNRLIQKNENNSIDLLIEPLGQITEQAQRAGRVIRFLRNFVKKAEPRRSSHQLNEVIEGVVRILAAELRHHQIEVEQNFQDDLPLVMIDSVQIEQVLVNLIRNAMDSLQESDVTNKQIALSTGVDEQQICVTVSDNGIGISDDQLQTIFKSFSTSKREGLGLGLSICKTIIEAHEGRLWLATDSKTGATFKFTVPLNGTNS